MSGIGIGCIEYGTAFLCSDYTAPPSFLEQVKSILLSQHAIILYYMIIPFIVIIISDRIWRKRGIDPIKILKSYGRKKK